MKKPYCKSCGFMDDELRNRSICLLLTHSAHVITTNLICENFYYNFSSEDISLQELNWDHKLLWNWQIMVSSNNLWQLCEYEMKNVYLHVTFRKSLVPPTRKFYQECLKIPWKINKAGTSYMCSSSHYYHLICLFDICLIHWYTALTLNGQNNLSPAMQMSKTHGEPFLLC